MTERGGEQLQKIFGPEKSFLQSLEKLSINKNDVFCCVFEKHYIMHIYRSEGRYSKVINAKLIF
jgi:hypothetical protein